LIKYFTFEIVNGIFGKDLNITLFIETICKSKVKNFKNDRLMMYRSESGII